MKLHPGFLRMLTVYFALLTGVNSVQGQSSSTKKYLDCVAEWSNEQLVLRNKLIERRWKISNGLLYNLSLKDVATGKEKLVAPSKLPSPHPEFEVQEERLSTTITASEWRPVITEAASLKVSINSKYKNFTLTTNLKIYPETAAISSWIDIEGDAKTVSAPRATGEPTGIEGPAQNIESKTDVNEVYNLENIHRILGVVSLMDATDVHDNLTQVNKYLLTVRSRERLSADLFYLEDQFTQDGVIFLKEAPLPYARPVKSAYDLVYASDASERFIFTGLGAGVGAKRQSYPFTTILYQGGPAGRTRALHNYQRRFRLYDPVRDEKIWHATWGDRNRDGRVRESFLMSEMDRLFEMGLDFLYFTDGWQKGPSSNSVVSGGVWENQWSRPDYWTPNPERFPNGLEPLIKKAKDNKAHIGMWHNPDKTNDYANWEKDAALILSNHKKYGVNNVKFDGASFTTKLAETNLLNAMHRVVEESNGRVAIEVDITAGVRTGYFSAMQYGFLFLENRYTDSRRYYPHCTLRNLWQLSHFVDPRRLRVEFLNNERNEQNYPNDPLAPAHYEADYLFAVTMFAHPLAWFEATGLSEKYARRLKQIIAAYKPHRGRIHEGNIFPIGTEPDGFSWTGFQSQIPGERDGYLVVFRELTDKPMGTFNLTLLEPGSYRFEALAGSGKSFERKTGGDGQIEVALPEKLNYGFYHYSRLDK